MYIFKRIRLRAIAGLAATCAVLLTTIAITSSTAMAMRVPPEGGDGVIQPPPVPVAGGCPAGRSR